MMERDALLDKAAQHARRYLDGIGERPVGATVADGELERRLGGPLPEAGRSAAEVLDELAAAARDGTVATQGPRFFGFVVGSSLPVATAADWLVAGWDQNAGLHILSPLNAVVEQVAGDWIRDIVGLPGSWTAGYVTGGSMANFTALAAARRHTLHAAGWDVEADGLYGAPPIRFLVNEEAHYSISTSLRMLGLGVNSMRRVRADRQGRMRLDDLQAALREGSGPCVVCAQAGNVNTGAFDSLEAIAGEAREAGAWLHVDGAFGLWAAASPELAHLLAGIEHADSISTDAHKWLNVPYDCGIVLCAHPDAHRGAMTLAAAYIQESPLERDPREYVPEESRRARAVPVYAVLRTLGRSGLRDLVERCCRHARRFAEGLRDGGFEILNDVVLNQVLVSFGEPEATRRVIAGIQNDGTCWCSGTEWQGRVAMRISVSSWATTDEDVERSLEAMLRIARTP
ncbi:MAG TPA: pyridoxal-dependent decarboxylase [Woeseiaceae bacterium]|nr:pyridoxal-dependent decarboxylase [Woeseiaceae bacterium]